MKNYLMYVDYLKNNPMQELYSHGLDPSYVRFNGTHLETLDITFGSWLQVQDIELFFSSHSNWNYFDILVFSYKDAYSNCLAFGNDYFSKGGIYYMYRNNYLKVIIDTEIKIDIAGIDFTSMLWEELVI